MTVREKTYLYNVPLYNEISKTTWISLLTIISLCMLATPVRAWMWEVDDQKLSEVTGEGFSSFTMTDDGAGGATARAFFNITASTFTEIDSLKMGYYDNGSGSGWDEDWTGVSLGSSTEDLVCRGLFLEAGFSNISNPGSRTLNYLKVGTPSMTGPISANFNSLTGSITDAGVTTTYNRTNLGPQTIFSNAGSFSVTVGGGTNGAPTGWRTDWGNAHILP
jgi:hypothetical protein